MRSRAVTDQGMLSLERLYPLLVLSPTKPRTFGLTIRRANDRHVRLL